MRQPVAALIGLAAVAFGAAQAAPADYKIDPDHTNASFAIDHNGASINRARFDEVSGTVSFDKAAKTGAIDITVQVRSVYSGSKGFDQHLLAPDLFNAAAYPTLRLAGSVGSLREGTAVKITATIEAFKQ